MWWRDNQPEIFDAPQIYALPQTVVLNSLTGEAGIVMILTVLI
ncbi:MAG: hypothetical protein CM1200mP30_30370 [Pseudomonadota bacterium]|nr:MAG: hypothetical protein CM1200mP30_30370 [Pseudomonadota bacterium]